MSRKHSWVWGADPPFSGGSFGAQAGLSGTLVEVRAAVRTGSLALWVLRSAWEVSSSEKNKGRWEEKEAMMEKVCSCSPGGGYGVGPPGVRGADTLGLREEEGAETEAVPLGPFHPMP